MPFIGTQPDVGGYSVLDALTASATASYTLQKDSANFVPSICKPTFGFIEWCDSKTRQFIYCIW